MAFRDKTKEALRNLIESQGDIGALEIIKAELNEGNLIPEDFSLREIWEATQRHKDGTVMDYSEAVTSDMFPKITGELINRTIIGAYDALETIGDKLTTNSPSNMEVETYAGFDAAEMPEEVLQGGEYNESDMGEKYTTVRHKKYGRLISITEEMIKFDKTGQIIMRAKKIGQKAAQYKEKLIIEGIQDINSDVFNPSGVATAFYRSAASGDRKINLATSAPFGEAGIEKMFGLVHDMTDENSDPVLISTANLYGLFPNDLWLEVLQMVRSAKVPEGNENADNIYKGVFTPLQSPYVSAQSSSAWYMGDFKEDFVWSEVYPLQTFSRKPGNSDEFKRDIKSQHKVRFMGEITAIDDKHSFKATA